MIVFESRKVKRVLCRLEAGEEMCASLLELVSRQRIRSGWVRGFGLLQWVELVRHDQRVRATEPPQRFEAPCELLTLEGSVSYAGGRPDVRLYGTMSRRTDNGIELLGGQILSASVFDCELQITAFEDVRLDRVDDDETGLQVWVGASHPGARAPQAPERPTRALLEDRASVVESSDSIPIASASSATPEASGGVSWADVAAVSAAPEVDTPSKAPSPKSTSRTRKTPSSRGTTADRRPRSPSRKTKELDYLDEPYPEVGDFIDHQQFGVCLVLKEVQDGGLIIRLPNGRRKTIKLDYMEVLPPRETKDARVFPVRPRSR